MKLPAPHVLFTDFDLPSVGECIYCGATSALTPEHIVPFAIDGTWVLPDASCKRCQDRINKVFEQQVLREYLLPLRYRSRMRSRRKSKAHGRITTKIISANGQERSIEIPAQDYLNMIYAMEFPLPGIFLRCKPSSTTKAKIRVIFGKGEINRVIKHLALNDGESLVGLVFYPEKFMMLLAKIAHGFAVSAHGVNGFRHRLPPLFLREGVAADTLSHLVGGIPKIDLPTPEYTHSCWFGRVCIDGVCFFTVKIRLFAFLGFPTYIVVVGEDLKSQSVPADAKRIFVSPW